MKEKPVIADYVAPDESIDWFYYIETEKASYHARELTRVMNMWKDSGDTSKVLNVGRLG
jgi:hypothetical protein